MEKIIARKVSPEVCSSFIVTNILPIDDDYDCEIINMIRLNREKKTFQAAMEARVAFAVGIDEMVESLPVIIRAITEEIPDIRLFGINQSELSAINPLFKFVISHPYNVYGSIDPNEYLDITVGAFDYFGQTYRLDRFDIYHDNQLVRSYKNYHAKNGLVKPDIKRDIVNEIKLR